MPASLLKGAARADPVVPLFVLRPAGRDDLSGLRPGAVRVPPRVPGVRGRAVPPGGRGCGTLLRSRCRGGSRLVRTISRDARKRLAEACWLRLYQLGEDHWVNGLDEMYGDPAL